MTPQEFKTIRTEMRYTQDSIAKLMGVSIRIISYYENGGRKVPGSVGAIMRLLQSSVITEHDIKALFK